MEKFSEYKQTKDELLKKFLLLKEKLQVLKDMKFNCEEDIDKVEKAITTLQKDEISIVLMGAFSDGKTSVIAGWLGEKPKNMKIDSDESSDELLYYTSHNLPDKCMIVDTPGLFGNKEKIDSNGKNIQFGEITKKCIDTANIILYVVEAKNPIKESHVSSLRWILHDLHKVSTIIFVINKMDEVADLTDPDDFTNMAEIKKENVRKKLKDMVGLGNEEIERIKIVCISSNPEGKGFEFWQEHRDAFEKRSHIIDLENATNNILKENTFAELVNKTGADTLQRVLKDNLKLVTSTMKDLEENVIPNIQESVKRNQESITNAKNEILKIRPRYRDELLRYERGLNNKIRGLSMDDAKGFLEDEIGIANDGQNVGYLLQEHLKSIADKYFQQIETQVTQVEQKFICEYDNQVKLMDSLTDRVGSGVAGAMTKMEAGAVVQPLKASIFAARDLIGKIGIGIKFRPWQVANFAKLADKAVPVAGAILSVVMEIRDLLKKKKRQEEFIEYKKQLHDLVSDVFKSIYDTIDDENKYFANYAPQIQQLDKLAQQTINQCDAIKMRRKDLEDWGKGASGIIDVEFSEIK